MTCLFLIAFISPLALGTNADGRNENSHPGDPEQTDGHEKQGKSSPIMLNYRPPFRGRPGNRVGGGTRGPDNGVPFLASLAPDHTGLTMHPQPALYWYISQPSAHRIEFTLINEQCIEPVLEVGVKKTLQRGIQGLRLSDHHVELSPGIEYQWFVAMVSDPDHRSKDIVAGGAIEYIEPSQGLINDLEGAQGMEVPAILAREGLWYDALDSITGLIIAHPDNEELQRQRGLLLEQVGLSMDLENENTKNGRK
ncbi:MAG: DUF928 domain-containing protein [bacterium]